jgi:glycosyltransferase involved in cell wall biosynthesis
LIQLGVEVALLMPGRRPLPTGRNARLIARARRLAWDLGGVTAAAARARTDLLHIPHCSAPIRPESPLVVTIHDVIPFVLPEYRASIGQRTRLAIVARTVRQARLVLTPSHHAAAEIERVLAIPAARIRVTPEAAGAEYRPAPDPRSPAIAEVRQRFGITGRYVFNVGGHDVRKNLPALIAAFARMQPHLTEPVQLVIAGAPHTNNLLVYPPMPPVIASHGLADQVVLAGFVSPLEKLALYQGADLYVTPSLDEGFGLTVLEAMACGVPVIAANRTSLPEVVGEAGVLVEPEPASLAAAMLALLDDPIQRAAWRRRGLARAATFRWDETARLTLAAYEEALAG